MKEGVFIFVREGLKRLRNDLHAAFVFMTRFPLPRLKGEMPPLGRTMWCFPLVGVAVGGAGALVLGGAAFLGMPLAAAAGLGVLTTILVTGGLHEDGIADAADAFGATADRTRRLEIMRDSRIGTFGALALIFSVGLRWCALAVLPSAQAAAIAMILAAAVGRMSQPLVFALVPLARKDGLAAAAGKPAAAVLVSFAIAAGLIWILVPEIGGLLVAIGLAASLIVSLLAQKAFGGCTGDVVGAASQTAETGVLLACSAAGSILWGGV